MLAISAQVLQRPGPFSLREFSLAVQKLHASATTGTSHPAKTGQADPRQATCMQQLHPVMLNHHSVPTHACMQGPRV
jgi:hypothetical protein